MDFLGDSDQQFAPENRRFETQIWKLHLNPTIHLKIHHFFFMFGSVFLWGNGGCLFSEVSGKKPIGGWNF